MDIVIPYKNSTSNGLELRYTLRGIEKYFPDLENVFIIGDCPGFIQHVIHERYPDSPQRHHKQANIYGKLIHLCYDKRVSGTFCWFSDDHFLLAPFVSEYNYNSDLNDSIRKMSIHQTYRNTLLNTQEVLGIEGKDYGHGPMVLDKEKFKRAFRSVDWSIPWGYAIKSVYCEMNNIPGKQFPDLKIKAPLSVSNIHRLIDGRPYFSIDDRGLNANMKEVLENLFPQKSIYEND